MKLSQEIRELTKDFAYNSDFDFNLDHTSKTGTELVKWFAATQQHLNAGSVALVLLAGASSLLEAAAGNLDKYPPPPEPIKKGTKDDPTYH